MQCLILYAASPHSTNMPTSPGLPGCSCRQHCRRQPWSRQKPAAVNQQMEIMLKAASVQREQAQYRPPTTSGPLTWFAALQLLTASHRPALQPVEPAVVNWQIGIMLTAAEMREEREQERFATLPLLMSRCAELLALNEGMTHTNSPCGYRVLMRPMSSLIAAVMA
jgi:hypothetical protein